MVVLRRQRLPFGGGPLWVLLVVLHQGLRHPTFGMEMARAQDDARTDGLQGLVGRLPAILQGPASAIVWRDRVDLRQEGLIEGFEGLLVALRHVINRPQELLLDHRGHVCAAPGLVREFLIGDHGAWWSQSQAPQHPRYRDELAPPA